MKKIAGLILVLMLVLAMAVPAIADNSTTHTITMHYAKAGHTYTAYRIFEGEISEGVLTNIKWSDGVNGEALLAALNGTADFASCTTAEAVADVLAGYENNSAKLVAFSRIVAEYLGTAAGESTQSGTAADGYTYTINVTGDGYYFVKDTGDIAEDAATKYILQVLKNVEIDVKAEAPTLEKKIVEGENLVDVNEGSVGDKVDYQLTSKVPAMDGYKNYFFVVKDTMSAGLTFNNDVAIKIGDTALGADDFDVTSDGNGNIEIVINNFISYKDQSGQSIKITYSATIDEDAKIGEEGNPNKVHLVYSNNPNVDTDGDKPEGDEANVTGKTPDDEVITYVSGIKLTKVDGENKILPGAKFEIAGASQNIVIINEKIYMEDDENGTYYRLKNGTYTTEAATAETIDQYDSTEIKYSEVAVVTQDTVEQDIVSEAWVNADGVLTFKGLGAGTYTITELVAPDGYNELDTPITVVISFDEDGDTKWSATKDGETLTEDKGLFAFNVVNKIGTQLPSTGGMGTTILYVGGGLLIAAALILLVAKKRTAASK